MKTKFWSVCTIAVLTLLGGVYFSTAQMSDAPSVLSDSQMEQLSGTLVDWTCQEFEACDDITCKSTTLVRQEGIDGCYSCETYPNDTCYYAYSSCYTCFWVQYKTICSGKILNTGFEEYRECDLN